MPALSQADDLDFGKFADPIPVILRALDELLPPAPVSVSEWTAEHRYLNNAGGGYVGRWPHDMTPYLIGPMDAFNGRRYDTMAVPGPGQSAKTSIAENALLHAVPNVAGKWLWYMQSDATIEAYVKDRIDPLIEDHACLRENKGLRPIDDSLHFKRFRRLKIEFLAANRSNMINKAAPVIVADEIDAYPEGLGDIKALLDVRRQTFGAASMLLAISHPDRATDLKEKNGRRGWTAGIMLLYGDSTQGRWYWPCPHCNEFSSPCPGAGMFMDIDFTREGDLDDVAASAHMICPRCGSVEIHDHHRMEMNRRGKWVHKGQTITKNGVVRGRPINSKTIGFWIVGAMSPFIRGGIGGLARARVKAEREAETTGDGATLKEVMVKQWGWPWAVKASRHENPVEVEKLLKRCEPYPLRRVPSAARFLTAWVDVQAHSFEVLVRAVGAGFETWIIDVFNIFKTVANNGVERPLEPASRAEDWDLLLSQVLARTYPLSGDETKVMGIVRMGVDSAGAAGVTARAYEFWRCCKKKGIGRRMLLTKGAAASSAPRFALRYPDAERKDRKALARGEVPVGFFNTNLLKDELDGQLRRDEPGDGFVHLSAHLRSDFPPHVFFEGLTAEVRRPDGKWIKEKQRNEPIDQMTGTHAVALSLKVDGVNWNNPPAWAAPLEANCYVFGAAQAPDNWPAKSGWKSSRRVISKGIG